MEQNGQLIQNSNTQYIAASDKKGEKPSVKVTKGGDLRAK